MGKYAIFIVSALIFSMLTYSSALRNALFTSSSRTVQSYSYNQAHNIAQSALMIAIKDVIDEGGNVTIPDEGDIYETGFQSWGDMHGEFNIVISHGASDDMIHIQSTGRYENSMYRVTAGLVPGGGGGGGFPWPALDSAIHSEENISVGNGNVYGDIYTGGKFSLPGNAQIYGDVVTSADDLAESVRINSGAIHGSLYTNATNANGVKYTNWGATIHGDLFVGPGADPNTVAPKIDQWHPGHVKGQSGALSEPIPEIEIDQPVFPESPQTPFSLPPVDLSGVDSEYIDLSSGNAYIPSINVQSSTHLTINVGNKKRTLRVSDFNMPQGHLNIVSEGEGSLELFVENSFNIGGSSSMNNNSNPGGKERNPLSLLIEYAGSNEFNVGGDIPINANIFVKDADLHLGASGKINGNIITGGENVTIDGDGGNNSRVVYAPNAHVTMTGSGKINGSVVAKTFDGQGDFRVTYTTEFEDTLPDLDSEGGGGSSDYSVAFWN